MKTIDVPQFVKGLIFDCDGTLVDSMPLHMKAWEYVIILSGGPWDYEFVFSKKGMPERDIVDLYNEHFGAILDPAVVVETKHRFFQSRASELKPIPHVVDLVYKYRGVLPMAVVSGGVRENVELELKSMGIGDFFQVILTADDGLRPKPAPDLFLEAAKRLGIAPEYCQAFEDGDLGLEAARTAGMLSTDVR
jgi:HAD superfamily hydrolase (TIGR01509 family)